MSPSQHLITKKNLIYSEDFCYVKKGKKVKQGKFILLSNSKFSESGKIREVPIKYLREKRIGSPEYGYHIVKSHVSGHPYNIKTSNPTINQVVKMIYKASNNIDENEKGKRGPGTFEELSQDFAKMRDFTPEDLRVKITPKH